MLYTAQDIVLRDLRIIENRNLRKLLTRRPHYRKPRGVTFSKAYFEIETWIEKITTKKKLETLTLTPWKESLLTMVKEYVTYAFRLNLHSEVA